jgi:hypothetical protein
MSKYAYEFDINEYSIPELVEKLHIKTKNLTESVVSEHIDSILLSCSEKDSENEEIRNFVYFLKSAKKKLIGHLREKNYLNPNESNPNNFPPTNSEIYDSPSILKGGDHDITQNKVVPVKYTNNWEFPDGVINPVDKRTITKVVCIDSLFRENYFKTSSSDFMWTLPENLKNVVSMKVVSLELPCAWYAISGKNNSNFFIIHLYNMTGQPDITHVVKIPDGNYMSASFEAAINNYFINIKQGLEFLYVDIDDTSGKSVIRARVNHDDTSLTTNLPKPYDPKDRRYSPDFYFIIDFVLDYREIVKGNRAYNSDYNFKNFTIDNKNNKFYKTLGWFLGFRKPYYKVTKENTRVSNTIDPSNPVTYHSYLESESSYGSSIQNYVFLDINDFNQNEIADSFVSSVNNSSNEFIGNNIIARITIATSFYSVLYDSSSQYIFKQRDYLGPVRLNKLQIRLLDKFGEILDLNDNNFSFSLEMTILYQ